MLETIKALTTEYDMLPRGGTVLCAVSGGADSMCLLHLLHTWAGEGGFRVAAAHYNHNLRGAESDRDAAFVAEWCAGQDIPCVIGAGDVAHEARARGLGVEETARQMRYEFLRGAADAMGCGRIATAHSADDNLETLLLHLVRGAGLHGLAGIPPRRGVVVRPLLTTSRAEIVAYLEANGVPTWRTAATPTRATPATASAARWCRCCVSSIPASLRARRRPWATCAPTTTI